MGGGRGGGSTRTSTDKQEGWVYAFENALFDQFGNAAGQTLYL